MGKDASSINVKQVLEYLTHTFEEATRGLGPKSKAVKGSKLYELQVEFAYLIDEIERGPTYMLPMVIQQANDLIEQAKHAVEEPVEAAE